MTFEKEKKNKNYKKLRFHDKNDSAEKKRTNLITDLNFDSVHKCVRHDEIIEKSSILNFSTLAILFPYIFPHTQLDQINMLYVRPTPLIIKLPWNPFTAQH